MRKGSTQSADGDTVIRTARELRRLPAPERGRILREQAEAAAPHYRDAQEAAERMAWQAGNIVEADTKQH